MKSKYFQVQFLFAYLKLFFFRIRHNTEKVIYFLLLDRKLKNPSFEEYDEIFDRDTSSKLITIYNL